MNRDQEAGRCCLGFACLILLGGVIVWILMSKMPVSLQLLHLYPKKVGSSLAGWGATRTLPKSMRGSVLGGFVGHYDINMNEAEKKLEDYESLQALFTRRLKPGLRPQGESQPGFINSPVDARVIALGRADQDTVIQAKGLHYRVSELLKYVPDAKRFAGCHYLTLYLSPKDYHRIHVPFKGLVQHVERVEGELWPVNDASTHHIERLYERNRRATWVAKGLGVCEGLDVAAVCVGATHVGGVVIADRWLGGRLLPKDGGFKVENLPCEPGDDLGTFEFGSTVVLLVGGPKAGTWKPVVQLEDRVQVGQRLGVF